MIFYWNTKYTVPLVFWSVCILVFLNFVLFVFCSICILFHLYFDAFIFCPFVFCHVCILEFLHFVIFVFCFIFWCCILFCLYYETFVFCHGFQCEEHHWKRCRKTKGRWFTGNWASRPLIAETGFICDLLNLNFIFSLVIFPGRTHKGGWKACLFGRICVSRVWGFSWALNVLLPNYWNINQSMLYSWTRGKDICMTSTLL